MEDAVAGFVGEEGEVEHGDEGGGLASGGEVGGAEVGDDGDAEALGEDAWFADLPGGSGGAGRGILRGWPGGRWFGRGGREGGFEVEPGGLSCSRQSA